MSYTITLTDGTVFATIADGTINTASSMVLVGKNYAGYGEFLDTNFIRLLESGSNTTAPGAPLEGQLWWDSGNNLLKVYNGTTFITIGPSFTAGTGTSGAIVDSITDNLGSSHVVVKLFVNESIVGMVSKDSSFTPQSAVSGFATINPGIQLSTSVSGSTFKGDATNAQLLDSLDSTQFLRSDAADTTSGTLGVLNDTGLTVGADGDIVLSVTGSDAYIKNGTSNGDIFIQVNKSVGGVTTAITIDGATVFWWWIGPQIGVKKKVAKKKVALPCSLPLCGMGSGFRV